MRYIEDLQNGIEKCIVENQALLIGEDIGFPYGGAFKVTKQLSEKYPGSFLTTPMSEQAFTGLGIGYALQGNSVIVEIMFGDFITLCADQLINHAAKLYDLYGRKVSFVLRTPSGGYRGYGATHSQCLERLFLGIPGLQVLAPSVFHRPGALLQKALTSGMPTLFIENKLDYTRSLYQKKADGFFVLQEENGIVSLEIDGEAPEAVLVTYGGMAPLAVKVCEDIMLEEEIPLQVLIFSDLNTTGESLAPYLHAKRILTIEEGWAAHGVGSGILSSLAVDNKKTAVLGAGPHSIYSGKGLEDEVLLQERNIIDAIMQIVS